MSLKTLIANFDFGVAVAAETKKKIKRGASIITVSITSLYPAVQR